MSFLQLAWHLSGLAVLVICLPLNALVPITTCILKHYPYKTRLAWLKRVSRRGKICIICYECSRFLQNMIFSTRFGTSWTDTRHGRWSKRTQGWTLSMRSSMGSRYKSSLKTPKRKREESQGYFRQGSKDVRLGAAVHGDDWRHQARFWLNSNKKEVFHCGSAFF